MWSQLNPEIAFKRESYPEQIRRINRDEIFNKRRTPSINSSIHSSSTHLLLLNHNDSLSPHNQPFSNSTSINDALQTHTLPQSIKMSLSSNAIQQHKGITQIRKAVYLKPYQTIQQLLKENIDELCLELVHQNNYPQIRFQAMSILTNITASTFLHTKTLVQKGYISIFLQLLQQNCSQLQDQVILSIGNLAVSQYTYRNKIIELDGLTTLLSVAKTISSSNTMKNIAWCVGNLVRGNPPPVLSKIASALEFLCKVLTQCTLDEDLLSECVCALEILTEERKSIQRFINTGIIPTFFILLNHANKSIFYNALKTIGNISVGTQHQTQIIIENGFLQFSITLLQHENKFIRKEVCWILSNIAAGTSCQVHHMLSDHFLIGKLFRLFEEEEVELKRQICYVWGNFSINGDIEKIIQFYIEKDIIQYLEKMLPHKDIKAMECVLTCLERMVRAGQKCRLNEQNLILKRIYNSRIGSWLEKVQEHPCKRVSRLSMEIMNKYFEIEYFIG